MAMRRRGGQSAAYREQHGDVSVLSRRLIESAAEAVLFVSVQRRTKTKKLFKKKRGGAEAHGRWGSRDHNSAPRTEADTVVLNMERRLDQNVCPP